MLSDEKLIKPVDPVADMVARVVEKALAEQAATHAIELRAYEATVANLNQRIRELEAQRVPEGWRLVPIYPTSDMLSAFDHCDAQGCQFAETYWDAMLAAAPAPKEGE